MKSDAISDERSVGEMFRDIERRLTTIEMQTLKTNGRVASLEKWKYGFVVGITTLALTKWPLLVPVLESIAQGALAK